MNALVRTQIKVTKRTAQDLGGAWDVYNDEPEYEKDLWDLEGNTLIINNAKGAALFLGCAHTEIDLCNEAMSDCYDRNDYARAYRAHARIVKVMDQVLETYKDEIVSNYYGSWEVK
jgi:hypothetical protein